jgi:hypothetical protein
MRRVVLIAFVTTLCGFLCPLLVFLYEYPRDRWTYIKLLGVVALVAFVMILSLAMAVFRRSADDR